MTTTIGIVCGDGVVIGSDSRATMGHHIASTTAEKVHKITETIGMTLAGSVGDAQRLIRWMQVEAKLYKMRREEPMTVKALVNLLASTLASSRMYPFSVSLLVGGMDKNGRNLYSLDAIGGVIQEHTIVSTGSGSPVAYGVLEDRYRSTMDTIDGVELAVRSLHTAMQRDSASGNHIRVVVIKTDEYIEISEEMVKRTLDSL